MNKTKWRYNWKLDRWDMLFRIEGVNKGAFISDHVKFFESTYADRVRAAHDKPYVLVPKSEMHTIPDSYDAPIRKPMEGFPYILVDTYPESEEGFKGLYDSRNPNPYTLAPDGQKANPVTKLDRFFNWLRPSN